MLKDLYDQPREPDIEEMDLLLYFAAIQYIKSSRLPPDAPQNRGFHSPLDAGRRS
jgi:hypothetical protein